NDSQKPIITIKAGKLYVNTTKEDQYYDKASIKDVNQVIEQNKKVKIEKDLIIKNEIFPLIGRKFALTSTEFNGFDNEGKPFHFTQPASSLQESYSCGSTSTQEPAETCYNPKFLQINSKREAVINGKVLARISLYKGSNDKDFSMMFLVSNPAKPNHSTTVLSGRVSSKGHQLSVRSLWTSPEGKTSESIYYFEELK
ncbi:MAG: hypothetical protein L6Q37_09950, partial [Bdellovibrionaceae bacterium]|nr:hypothetical protein [Pseudobdellovibrionaceae bacterium]